MKYSLQAYRRVIQAALSSGYDFRAFPAVEPVSSGAVYLRHDVDYSPALALELAQVNAELGICGTFMLLLRAESYNLLSPTSLSVATRIMAAGQSIGLHARVPTGAQLPEITALLRSDFAILNREIPGAEAVFSWHNPTAEILERTADCSEIAGLLNSYARPLIKSIRYLSDSNLRNGPDDFIDFFRTSAGASLQLLIHPLNWAAGGDGLEDIFARTWRYVIRGNEVEMRQNRWYSAVFPEGMPESVPEGFASAWAAAARSPSAALPEALPGEPA